MTIPIRKRVLCIDDEPLILELLADHLEESGFTALIARDAITGVRTYVAEKPDAIISDMRMPGGGGLGVLSYVRGHLGHSTPIIILSGMSDYSQKYLESAGAALVLSKPIDFDVLTEHLRKALTEKSLSPVEADGTPRLNSQTLTLELKIRSSEPTFTEQGVLIDFGSDTLNLDIADKHWKLGQTAEILLTGTNTGIELNVTAWARVVQIDPAEEGRVFLKLQLTEGSSKLCGKLNQIIETHQELISSYLRAAKGV